MMPKSPLLTKTLTDKNINAVLKRIDTVLFSEFIKEMHITTNNYRRYFTGGTKEITWSNTNLGDW